MFSALISKTTCAFSVAVSKSNKSTLPFSIKRFLDFPENIEKLILSSKIFASPFICLIDGIDSMYLILVLSNLNFPLRLLKLILFFLLKILRLRRKFVISPLEFSFIHEYTEGFKLLGQILSKFITFSLSISKKTFEFTFSIKSSLNTDLIFEFK